MKQKEGIRSQKSTSQTYLADGTKISTTEVIETDPNTNIQVETTTVVKEYIKETDMERGQILVEDVKETTTTRREWRIRDMKCENGVEVVGMTVGFSLPLCGQRKDVNDTESLLKDSEDEEESSNGSGLLDTFPTGKSKSSKIDKSKSCITDDEEPQTKSNVASSAFAMLTSPASFFRKTNLNLNTNESTWPSTQEVNDPKNSSATSEQREKGTSQAYATSNIRGKAASQVKASFNMDEAILNIVKKDADKESRAALVKTSQQNQNSQPPQAQSRETAPSKCVDKEEREGNNSQQRQHKARSTPVPCLQPSTYTRRLAAPSPTFSLPSQSPSLTKATNKPSPRNLAAPAAPSPTLTKSSSSKLSKRIQDTKPTTVKHIQSLLPQDSDFAAPKLTLSSTTAAVTDDKYLHFFSYALQPPEPGRQLATWKWRKSTTVSIENTYCMNVNICGNTAVVGVPYDRNIKGLLTGAAYIFEREEGKDIWTQVKKIVPKEISEFATVGYSVGIYGDLIAVSVPNVGSTVGGGTGGSVYLYRRVQKYKWAEKGILTPPSVETANTGGKAPGAAITVVNKCKKGLSKKKKFGTRVAVQGNVVVVSDHYDHEETAVCVFEYDDFSLQWTCIQDNLLSESQQLHFGSRLALTNNGNGILIGCHAKMTPTEVLYYSRYGSGGKFHLQQVIVVSKRASVYGVGRGVVGKNGVTEDISDFKVDGKQLIISTTSSLGQQHQNCVYIYQLQTNDTWVLMAKVDNPAIEGFGQCMGLSGNRVLIASRGNAYSYNLEKLIPKSKRKEFMAIANITEEKKKLGQPKPQVKYIDPDYLQAPYIIGSDLNDFRTTNQAALRKFSFNREPINSNGGEKSSQNSTASPSRMSLTMAPAKSRMSRMRSPSPFLRRLRGSSLVKKRKDNVSAPPLRTTHY